LMIIPDWQMLNCYWPLLFYVILYKMCILRCKKVNIFIIQLTWLHKLSTKKHKVFWRMNIRTTFEMDEIKLHTKFVLEKNICIEIICAFSIRRFQLLTGNRKTSWLLYKCKFVWLGFETGTGSLKSFFESGCHIRF
jgi:hypothetical protein